VEGVIPVVEGSKAMEVVIIVEIGAICLMSAQGRNWISVLIVEGWATGLKLVGGS
ncbi:hypothetical protein A2U01_0116534, partial [Trifolium medium]|nr:hypothetical protein [Trifolium medium]